MTHHPQQPLPVQPAYDPGLSLGIVGIVMLVIGLPFIGIFLSIAGHKKSKKAGHQNTIAQVGIWLNAILLALYLIALAMIIPVIISIWNESKQQFEAAQKTVSSIQELQQSYEGASGSTSGLLDEYIRQGKLPDGSKLIEAKKYVAVGEVGYEKCLDSTGKTIGAKLYYLEPKEDNYVSGSSNVQTQVIGVCG